jgi:hypothetical protein
MSVGYVLFHLLQKESSYMIAMILQMQFLGMTTKGKCDVVNKQYTVANSK